MFPKLEEEILEVTAIGSKITLTLKPEDAYGNIDEKKVQKQPILPEEMAKVKEKLEAERVRAESNIQRERDAAIEELRKVFAGLPITAAEKVVKTSLDEEGHRALIDGVLNDEGSRNN